MNESPAPIKFPEDISPGARLRQAREAANLSVREISAALHLDQKMIEALEAGSSDRLPAPTFVRGYIRSYARELGLPPGPLLKAYDLQGLEPPALIPDITEAPQTHASDLAFRLVTYAVGAGLLLLVVLWWQSQDFEGISIDSISDIGGDLIGWSSGSTSEPPLPATEAPMPAATPKGGEGGDISTATAGGPPEPPRDTGLAGGFQPPPPPSAEGTESGDIVVAAGPPPDEDTGAFGATADREAPATPAALPAETAAGTGPPPDEDTGAFGATADREAPATPAALPAETAAGTGPPPDEDTGAFGATADREAPATSAALPAETAAGTGPPPDDDTGASGATADRDAPATPAALSAGIGPSPDEDAGASGATADRDAPATPAALSAETAAGTGPSPDRDAGASGATTDAEVSARPADGPDTLPAMTSPATPSRTRRDALDEAAALPSISGTAQSELVLDFTHESWLEVYDSDDARLFFGLVQPGRVLNLTGAPPFDVLIGYARDVRVTLDGSPFDYAPHTRHGVARFSLGALPGATSAP